MKKLLAAVGLALAANSAVASPEIFWAGSRAMFCSVYDKDKATQPVNNWSGFTYVEQAWVFQTGEGQIHIFNGNGHSSDSPYMKPVKGSNFLTAKDDAGYTWGMGTGEMNGFFTIQNEERITLINCTKQVL